MSIFSNETEEEKNLKKLAKAIKYSNINSEFRTYLSNYIMKVSNGEVVNDFYTFDYLNRVILKIVEVADKDYQDPNVSFKKIVSIMRQFIPEGDKAEDFDVSMEMFINSFLGENGLIEKNLFNSKFYYLFENKYDFIYIMNTISNDEILTRRFNEIANYALEVCRFCSNQQILKHEIISFINGIENEYGSVEEFYSEMLNSAMKRCGVYPIDEAGLASITREAEKAQGLIRKLDSLQKKVYSYEEKITELTKNGRNEVTSAVRIGKKDINDLKNSSLQDMNEMLAESKADIIEKLDNYILLLEEELRNSSNQVFNKILTDTQDKVREIRLAASSLSQTTASELIRIRTATEESVSKLKDYVENDSKLKEMLKGLEIDDRIKTLLLNLEEGGSKKEQEDLESTSPSIIIPGYDRVVSPANPSIVVPDNGISRNVIPAFDESIPFDVRMERILKLKEEEETRGEIFHELTDEVIKCILEGDWPYLWGPSGCGKTHSIKQIARLIGIDMLDNGKITDKYSIMAYNDPHGRFRATQAFVALVYGKLLLFDEFDNGNPDTQVVLNELYTGLLDTLADPNELVYVTFAEDMRVPIHPNFRMIAAGNTTGAGENDAFSSRGKIDESVQQRMTPKRFWYDNRIEKRIFGNNANWYNLFVNFRKICDDYAKRQGLDAPIGVVTTRDADAIAKYIMHNSKSIEQVMDEKFVQTKNEDYLRFIMNRFKSEYNISSFADSGYYRSLSDCSEKELAKILIKRCDTFIAKK